MRSQPTEFTVACLNAFRFLVDRYGFLEPEVEPLGRETFVRYHRRNHTVSVAYEPPSPPLVELFYPSAETGEREVPWAERNGIARTRRIPRLNVEVPFIEGEHSNLDRYLESSAHALERQERKWLEALSDA
jgi:hypothetical protein